MSEVFNKPIDPDDLVIPLMGAVTLLETVLDSFTNLWHPAEVPSEIGNNLIHLASVRELMKHAIGIVTGGKGPDAARELLERYNEAYGSPEEWKAEREG